MSYTFHRSDATFSSISTDDVTAVSWTAYTPTVSSFAGTITTKSATGRYVQIGKTVHFQIVVTITTNGSGATAVVATLPIAQNASFNYYMAGRDVSAGGMLQGFLQGSGGVLIQTAAGSYPGADGKVLAVSGTYEAA